MFYGDAWKKFFEATDAVAMYYRNTESGMFPNDASAEYEVQDCLDHILRRQFTDGDGVDVHHEFPPFPSKKVNKEGDKMVRPDFTLFVDGVVMIVDIKVNVGQIETKYQEFKFIEDIGKTENEDIKALKENGVEITKSSFKKPFGKPSRYVIVLYTNLSLVEKDMVNFYQTARQSAVKSFYFAAYSSSSKTRHSRVIYHDCLPWNGPNESQNFASPSETHNTLGINDRFWR